MPTRSTLLYSDASLQPAAAGGAGSSPLMGGVGGVGAASQQPSPPPPPPASSSPPPGANGSFGSAGGEGEGDGEGGGLGLGFSLVTAGMNVADDGDRAPEEIDQLLQEFLAKASD